MAYTVKLGNITEIECDVIVNSLGINGSVYGRLCESIIEAANSPEIKKYIDSRIDSPVGFIYETKAGDLPCKKLYHIVTPHKFMDDENNTMLRQAYQDIIDKAIKQGYKSISLPFIGTGANGYAETEVFDIVVDICGKLSVQEAMEDKEILDIIIVSFLKPKRKKVAKTEELERPYVNEARMYYEKEYYYNKNKYTSCDGIALKTSIPSKKPKLSDLSKNVIKCAKFMGEFDPEELIESYYKKYHKPYDFVEDYAFQKGISTYVLNENGIGEKFKSKLKTGTRTLEKDVLFFIAIYLNMNKSNLIQFMLASGYSFKPSEELDMFMIDFMNGKYGIITNPLSILHKCYEVTGIWVEFEYK